MIPAIQEIIDQAISNPGARPANFKFHMSNGEAMTGRPTDQHGGAVILDNGASKIVLVEEHIVAVTLVGAVRVGGASV
jgi:hypothetical protein